MRSRLKCLSILLVLLGVCATLLASCGSTEAEAEPQSDVTCFESMSSDQRAQLIEYTDKLPANEKQNDDGTSDICVMEKTPDGSYEEHHYNKDDHFGDYFLLSMMASRSNALLGYGVLSGELDVGEAMALSLLTGYDSGMGMYHPYSFNSGGYYERRPTYTNVYVTNVQYGNQPPVKYDGKSRPPKPAGYNDPKKVPTKSDKVAVVTKDSSGVKGVVKEDTSTKASDVMSGKAKPAAKTTNTVKANPSSPSTVARPSNNSSSGNKPSSGGNAPSQNKPSSGGNSSSGNKAPSGASRPSSGGKR